MLEVKALDAYYGQIHALKDVSIEVGKGEIVTIIGANGAGKTTLLKVISGLVKPRKGEVLLEGEDLLELEPHEIVVKGVIHVPEGRRIFGQLTVKENLEMGAFVIKDSAKKRRIMEKVFELFPRLRERAHQLGGTLSGGEQQMLAMGRALMGDPRVLLLDEPSMGLAPVLVEDIFNTIVRLHEEGKTILLVEQNARMALEVAHRGYVLQTGSVVLSDTAGNLADNELVRKAYLGEE